VRFFVKNNNSMATTGFYRELGRLLYAFANADGTITTTENAEISRQIRERLLHRELQNDKFGSNEAWITQFSFDTAVDKGMPPREAMQGFMDFAKMHADQVTDAEMEISLKMCEHIAEVYHHRNKKENALLAELRTFLLELHASQLIF
jgi:hypothetical protein